MSTDSGQSSAGAPLLEDEVFSISAYVQAAVAYWWIVAPLFVIGVTGALVFCQYAPRRYRATCRLEVLENNLLQMGGETGTTTPASRRRGNPNLERAIIHLTGSNLATAAKEKIAAKWHISSGDPRANVIVRASPVSGADYVMFDLRVDSFDAKYSVALIEALLGEYRSLMYRRLDQTLSLLRREQEKLAQRLTATQDELTAFEASHNITFEREKSQSETTHLSDILEKVSAVRTQRTILQSQFPFLKDASAPILRDVLDLTIFSTSMKNDDEKSAPGWSDEPQWRAHEEAVVQLQMEYQDMIKVYKPKHPKMLALTAEIEKARRQLRTTAELTLKRLVARRDALEMQERALEEAAKGIRTRIDLTAADRAEYDRLRAKAEHLQALHDRVFSHIIDSSTSPRDADWLGIVEGPAALAAAVWPSPARIIPLGGIAGLVLGCILAVLLFRRRMYLYNLGRVEQSMGVSVLAYVPKVDIDQDEAGALFLQNLPKNHPACEAYRTLRTNLEAELGDGRILLVASPEPREGKTFTAVNVALVFAWRQNERVLLVDADFRRTTLSSQFVDGTPAAGEARTGLIDCLKDDTIDWRPSVVHDVAPNLSVLPAGAISSNAAELLHGSRLTELLAEMRDEFRLVVIDSAPVNRIVDGVLLSRVADAVLLVAVPGKTSLPAIRHALGRLSAASVAGYVANQVTPSAQRYYGYSGGGGYYGYGYDYGYGYGYGYGGGGGGDGDEIGENSGSPAAHDA